MPNKLTFKDVAVGSGHTKKYGVWMSQGDAPPLFESDRPKQVYDYLVANGLTGAFCTSPYGKPVFKYYSFEDKCKVEEQTIHW